MDIFKPIPDESAEPNFICRPIRKISEDNLLSRTITELQNLQTSEREFLASELGDLVEMLHRVALKVQKRKQKILLAKLKKLNKN